MTYLRNIAIAIDQLAGTIFLGANPDETISAWAYRTDSTRFVAVINWLFQDKQHCYDSYKSEVSGAHLPDEYRKAGNPGQTNQREIKE